MTDLDATWDEKLRGPRMSETTGRVIFKYQMPVKEVFEMDLPEGAEIIRVQDQDGMFWMWAVVNTDAPMKKRYFRAFKTGAKMPDGVELKYIGFCAIFVQMELGLYIFEDLSALKQMERMKDRFQVKQIPNPVENTKYRSVREMVRDPANDEMSLGDLLEQALRAAGRIPQARINQVRVDIEEARQEEEEE